jgi:hypothetical protein
MTIAYIYITLWDQWQEEKEKIIDHPKLVHKVSWKG